MSTFNIANPIKIVNPNANLDSRYGPWVSVIDANNNIPQGLRQIGLTVGVSAVGLGVVEYWYKNGVQNTDLIIKTSGGGSLDLSTVTNYLSTNNVLLSAATITTNVSAKGLIYSPSILPALPVPKVLLLKDGGSPASISYLNSGLAVAGNISLYGQPCILTSDFTNEELKTYQIFIEMVIFKKKSKKDQLFRGQTFTTPKGSTAVPWGNNFWTRSGNDLNNLYMIRYNHIPVLSSNASINVSICLNNHLIEKPVYYRDANNNKQSVNLIVPCKNSKTNDVTGNIFGYSKVYKPLYVAFRYIAWLPQNNNGRGQIVSGPLSKTIRIANTQFPFILDHYSSSLWNNPIVKYKPITKTNFICKFI